MMALHYKPYFIFPYFLLFFFSILHFPFFFCLLSPGMVHGLFWHGFGFGFGLVLVWPGRSHWQLSLFFLEGFLGRAHSGSFLGSALVFLGVSDGVKRNTYLWRMEVELVFTKRCWVEG